MRVLVAGDYKTGVLLDTQAATAVLIETNDGKPAMILRLLPDGSGYIRLVKGEDKNFDEQARQLGLI